MKANDATERQQVASLRTAITKALASFADSILEAERNLVTAPLVKREQAFNYILSFLMSFASRSGTRERLQLFTTNYDRYIEAGADVAGLRLIDRFVGPWRQCSARLALMWICTTTRLASAASRAISKAWLASRNCTAPSTGWTVMG